MDASNILLPVHFNTTTYGYEMSLLWRMLTSHVDPTNYHKINSQQSQKDLRKKVPSRATNVEETGAKN